MRPGHATGHADLADLLPTRHARAVFHDNPVQMVVHRDQPLAVVEEHGVAVEEIIAGVDHDAGRGRDHHRARGRGDVEPAVRRARLVVEEAPQAEAAAQPPARRQVEMQRRLRQLGPGMERLLDQLLLARNPLEVFGIRLDQALVCNGEVLGLVFLGPDRECQFAARAAIAHGQALFARNGLQRQPDHRLPLVLMVYHHHALAIEARVRDRLGVGEKRNEGDAPGTGFGCGNSCAPAGVPSASPSQTRNRLALTGFFHDAFELPVRQLRAYALAGADCIRVANDGAVIGPAHDGIAAIEGSERAEGVQGLGQMPQPFVRRCEGPPGRAVQQLGKVLPPLLQRVQTR